MGFAVTGYDEKTVGNNREHRVMLRATGYDRLAHAMSSAVGAYFGILTAIDESLVRKELFSRADFMRGERERRARQVALQHIAMRNGNSLAELSDIVVGWDNKRIYATYTKRDDDAVDSE